MKITTLIALFITSISQVSYSQEQIVPALDLSWATKIQKEVEKLRAEVDRDIKIPTGSIIAFYGDKIPKGWMLCDGSTIPADFEKLRELVGEKVPDLRGTFLRGVNNGRSDGKGDSEVDRKLGSFQLDSIVKHQHSVSLSGSAGNNAFVNRSASWCYDNWQGAASTATTSESGGAETRPKNIAVNFLIKI